MYTSFFGLNEKPFSITPDPRYLFMSERHGEALAHLVYGVTESGGFIQLTGEVGTGKTTLVRTLLQNRLPENADVAVVLNPQLSALEFLQTICEELGVPEPDDDQSIKSLIDSLNHFLLMAHAEGRRTILVVDEAQNLARDVLEQVRLLTNLETSKQKLLQIILIGQPELRELLARNDLRQLAQRITGRYHLEPLSRDESAQYIEHRLRVAGALGEVFDKGAKAELFRLSQGVPRLINVICDRALLGAYSLETRRVNRRLVRRAWGEISGSAWLSRTPSWVAPSMLAAGAAVIAVGAWSVFTSQSPAPPPAEAAPAVVQQQPAPIASPAAVEQQPEAAAPVENPIEGTEPEEPDLDEQLVLAGDLTGLESALGALLGLWGVDYSPGARPCDQAAEAGMQCLTQDGSWNNLRQLDRPAVLRLTDRRGDPHWAVLTAIEGDRAELSIGGVLVSHRIDAVADLWFGRYYMIWKPPNGVSLDLMPGTQDPNVVWLRQSLAEINERYRAEPMDSDIYDARLEQRVREFQRDNRLTVDGLAGRQTQIIINSLLAPEDIPRLVTPRLARD
ncbi:MAG: AAA family ATPase [Woeseiaceae bacterium]|nr:AAA family ATPase [Woeseiaceae bacterium]